METVEIPIVTALPTQVLRPTCTTIMANTAEPRGREKRYRNVREKTELVPSAEGKQLGKNQERGVGIDIEIKEPNA
jgi:hypothetical protein